MSEILILPGLPGPEKRPRRLLDPIWDGAACIYMTSHATCRMKERFRTSVLKNPPFSACTYYCEPDDIIRPVWAIPITNGFILGRWEEAQRSEVPYRHWFVATTCITKTQFRYSHLIKVKAIKINVLRVVIQPNSKEFQKIA